MGIFWWTINPSCITDFWWTINPVVSLTRENFKENPINCEEVPFSSDEEQSSSDEEQFTFNANQLNTTRDEKTDLPNVKGEVKRALKATFAHLCTTLMRDKCLPLLAVKGESSGDKGRFCRAFNPYL